MFTFFKFMFTFFKHKLEGFTKKNINNLAFVLELEPRYNPFTNKNTLVASQIPYKVRSPHTQVSQIQ